MKKQKQSKKPDSSSNSTEPMEGPALKAHKLVNLRSEEQQRKHGPFIEGMEKAAIVATILCGKGITAEDMYKCLMALKISRLSNSIELDSLTDLCGYTDGLWSYKQYEKK